MDLQPSVTVPFEAPEKYCRLCLSKNGLTELFPCHDSVNNKTTDELVAKIYQCTSIKLSAKTDGFCAICSWCVRTVKDFHRFRVRTKEVNELLKTKVAVAAIAGTLQHRCFKCSALFHHARSLRLHKKMACSAAFSPSNTSTLPPLVEPTSITSGEGGTNTVANEQIPAIALQSKKTIKKKKTTKIKIAVKAKKQSQQPSTASSDAKRYCKPPFSYACLNALAMTNSYSGLLEVGEIYTFMCKHFPYFRTAKHGWKNALRHSLSTSKCFEKIAKRLNFGMKGFQWRIKPSKVAEMHQAMQDWCSQNPSSMEQALEHPDHLDALLRGDMKHGVDVPDCMFMEDYLESDAILTEAAAVDGEDEEVVDLNDTEDEEENKEEEKEDEEENEEDEEEDEEENEEEDEEEEEEEEDEEEEDDDVELISDSKMLEFDDDSYLANTLDSLIAEEHELQKQLTEQTTLQVYEHEAGLQEEEDDDDVVLVLPKRERIDFDAECSIINMPELLIDEEEQPDKLEEFNLVVPDKNQRQPPAKRMNDDGNGVAVSFQQHFEQLQREQFRHWPHKKGNKRRKD